MSDLNKSGIYSIFPRLDNEARAEIMDTLSAYGYFFDNGDIDSFTGLCSNSATFSFLMGDEVKQQASGREEIHAFFSMIYNSVVATPSQPRHYLTNPVFTSASDSRINLNAAMLYTEYELNTKQSAVKQVGRYEFEFVKDDRAWLIDRWVARYDGFGA